MPVPTAATPGHAVAPGPDAAPVGLERIATLALSLPREPAPAEPDDSFVARLQLTFGASAPAPVVPALRDLRPSLGFGGAPAERVEFALALPGELQEPAAAYPLPQARGTPPTAASEEPETPRAAAPREPAAPETAPVRSAPVVAGTPQAAQARPRASRADLKQLERLATDMLRQHLLRD